MNRRNFIIGCDVDDVIVDLVTPWLNKHNALHGDTVKKKDIHTWAIASHTNLKDNQGKFYNLLNAELYESIDLIDGALEGISRLREYGRVIFITSNFGNVGRPKFEALNRLGLNVDKKDYFECSDKSLIAYDVLFDDNIDNAQRAYMSRGVLFTQPWNFLNNTTPRVNNWNQVVRFVEKMGEL